MKKKLLFVVAALACALCVAPALAEMKGDAHLWLGKKWMSSDWEPLDKPKQYGVGADFGMVDWPVMIAVDLLFSSDDHSYTYDYGYGYFFSYNLDVDGTELDLGVRKSWTNHDRFHPYVGGGLAYNKQEARVTFSYPEVFRIAQNVTDSVKFDDSATGFWLNAGVNWAITPKFYVGLDLRYSDADVEFRYEDIFESRQVEGVEKLNGGGTHAGIVFGLRF